MVLTRARAHRRSLIGTALVMVRFYAGNLRLPSAAVLFLVANASFGVVGRP
jgi:hypothetical protein